MPGAEMENMRRARLEGTCINLRNIRCSLATEGLVFAIDGFFVDNETGWLPADDGMVPRTTKIEDIDGWRLRCETQHEVDVGGSDEGGFYRTVGISTRCKSEGRKPAVELFLDGWPNMEGLLLADGKEYTVTSLLRGNRPTTLMFTERNAKLSLAIGTSNYIWIRRGLGREERKTLLRVGASLWTAPGLRANEGGRIHRK
jgi:hypothetical protein